ncbi:MAG: hypothetical protein RIG63_24150 [Coleofasciculus chthonoplastes F3-SA18-01]|uniref:AlbA family DNA-binding domain-containing protein n=1 Tax=Coleofasciculus chthonoplastes TaxID=64178 RepID=UPI0033017DC1
MNSRQIESWALRVIDCVKKGQPNEDFLVELKRDWIDKEKAARRIAGYANAARGENILWLIGVDENQGVIGVNITDLASWYPAVESCFNELAPRMIPLNIPVDGKTVVALLFETDRAPFVVKNPVYGSSKCAVELEVPWRENTLVRSARRSDLIRLLAPLERLPDVEIIDCDFTATIKGEDSFGNCTFDALELSIELYLVPKNNNRIVIPFHRCKVEFEMIGITTIQSNWIGLEPARGKSYGGGRTGRPGSLTIQSTAYEIIIDDPGMILLKARSRRPSLPDNAKNCDVRIFIHLLPTDFDRPVVLTKTLPYPK